MRVLRKVVWRSGTNGRSLKIAVKKTLDLQIAVAVNSGLLGKLDKDLTEALFVFCDFFENFLWARVFFDGGLTYLFQIWETFRIGFAEQQEPSFRSSSENLLRAAKHDLRSPPSRPPKPFHLSSLVLTIGSTR